MIYGLGTDIVEIKRIAQMLDKHGNAFIKRVFTIAEIAQAEKRKDYVQYYAGRWAAKEALSKALGCGIGEQCSWRDISIIATSTGAPHLTISENALCAAGLTNADRIHLSISHEQHYACATVIIEKD
jgi:holo-[acyl-carrier protein] synthase